MFEFVNGAVEVELYAIYFLIFVELLLCYCWNYFILNILQIWALPPLGKKEGKTFIQGNFRAGKSSGMQCDHVMDIFVVFKERLLIYISLKCTRLQKTLNIEEFHLWPTLGFHKHSPSEYKGRLL